MRIPNQRVYFLKSTEIVADALGAMRGVRPFVFSGSDLW
jgi:hypothetical protein